MNRRELLGRTFKGLIGLLIIPFIPKPEIKWEKEVKPNKLENQNWRILETKTLIAKNPRLVPFTIKYNPDPLEISQEELEKQIELYLKQFKRYMVLSGWCSV